MAGLAAVLITPGATRQAIAWHSFPLEALRGAQAVTSSHSCRTASAGPWPWGKRGIAEGVLGVLGRDCIANLGLARITATEPLHGCITARMFHPGARWIQLVIKAAGVAGR